MEIGGVVSKVAARCIDEYHKSALNYEEFLFPPIAAQIASHEILAGFHPYGSSVVP